MQPDISYIANIIGDPSRARMLTALMGGQALTATELSLEADISAQTASTHLAKLLEGHLISVRKQGRHKYFQLYDDKVAKVLEQLLNLTALRTNRTFGPADPLLKKARVCYDHLAGEIAVKLYDVLVAKGFLLDLGAETILTEKGRLFFEKQGFDSALHTSTKRPVCRSCLDWSERRNHLAGQLGLFIINDLFNQGWAKRVPHSRAVEFSEKGYRCFAEKYGLDLNLMSDRTA